MKKWGLRLIYAWGVIQLFNVVAGSNTLLELSQSIHWIAGWWNYFLKIPFDWINWDVGLLARNTIVLFLLSLSAVNMALTKDGHPSIFYLWCDMFFATGSEAWHFIGNVVQSNYRSVMITEIILVVMLILLAILAIIFHGIDGYVVDRYAFLTWYCLMGLWSISIYRISFEKIINKPILGKFWSALSSFIIVGFGFNALALIIYRKQVFGMLSAVVALVLLDVAFTHVIDPFAPFLENLPKPPVN